MWPRVEKALQKAIETQREWPTKDLFDQLRGQRMQLWVVPWDVVVVTQIQTYPGARICMIVLCGGENLETHMQDLGAIETWAKSLGCDEMRLQGRKGWNRIYPDYEPIATVMRKML